MTFVFVPLSVVFVYDDAHIFMKFQLFCLMHLYYKTFAGKHYAWARMQAMLREYFV